MEGLETIFSTEPSFEIKEYVFPNSTTISLRLMSLHKENGQIASSVSQVLWPAATELSKYLLDHTKLFDNKDIIELGAGTGLLGIVLYLSTKAKSIKLTDGDANVLYKLVS